MSKENLIFESQVEELCVDWFKDIGYEYKCGYDIAPDTKESERSDYKQTILVGRLRGALKRLNPEIDAEIIENSITQLVSPEVNDLISCNKFMNSLLIKGLKITKIENDQEIGLPLKIIDFENINNNNWLVVNQFKV